MSDQHDLFESDQPEADVSTALETSAEAGDGGKEWGPSIELKEDGHLRRLIDENFIQYASYVIRDRAIPDLSDGLKPVQRRILHSLRENDDGKFIKVANIVGHTMQYHPHGDASIADALVTLTNKRYLIEGQGNFGNIHTGDRAAASRYIECRLTPLARDESFNEKITKYVPSYDGRRKEPLILPAKLPLLLMMGAEGIAVGLSTRILPHNFIELLEGQIAILKKEPFEILPDFQQGCLMDATEYDKGNGKIRVRAEMKDAGSDRVVISSIPFGTTTDSVIASIEDAAKKKKLKVKGIQDFTSEKVEIEVTLHPEQNAGKAMKALYAFTQCEVSISSRIIAIRKGRPVALDVNQVLKRNTRRLVKLLERELQVERKRLLEELHHKTLVQLFVENRIYKRIEECKSYPDVQKAVLDGVNAYRNLLRRDVTANDVEMLLGIKIKRISKYDMTRNRKEIGDVLSGLEEVEESLEDLTAFAIRYLRKMIRRYQDAYPRLTKIQPFDEIEVRDLIADEYAMVYDQEKGYLGYDVKGEPMFHCSSLDRILVLWKDGTYKVMSPPDKLFVDQDVIYCDMADRDKEFTLVYREDEGVTYLKKFTFGGAILNKKYRCASKRSEVLLFDDSKPKALYVRYKKRKNQRIHQQVFDLKNVKVRGAKTKGIHLTLKDVDVIHTHKPRGWKDSGPRGVLFEK